MTSVYPSVLVIEMRIAYHFLPLVLVLSAPIFVSAQLSEQTEGILNYCNNNQTSVFISPSHNLKSSLFSVFIGVEEVRKGISFSFDGEKEIVAQFATAMSGLGIKAGGPEKEILLKYLNQNSFTDGSKLNSFLLITPKVELSSDLLICEFMKSEFADSNGRFWYMAVRVSLKDSDRLRTISKFVSSSERAKFSGFIRSTNSVRKIKIK